MLLWYKSTEEGREWEEMVVRGDLNGREERVKEREGRREGWMARILDSHITFSTCLLRISEIITRYFSAFIVSSRYSCTF